MPALSSYRAWKVPFYDKLIKLYSTVGFYFSFFFPPFPSHPVIQELGYFNMHILKGTTVIKAFFPIVC